MLTGKQLLLSIILAAILGGYLLGGSRTVDIIKHSSIDEILRLAGINRDDRPLIMLAAERENAISVKYILANNVDPDQCDKYGHTALMSAAQQGNLDIVTTLVDGGADLNIKDNEGHSALYHARENDRQEVISFLRSAGAIDDYQDAQ